MPTKTELWRNPRNYIRNVDDPLSANLSDDWVLCSSCGINNIRRSAAQAVGKSGRYVCIHCKPRNGFNNVRRLLFVEAVAKLGCFELQEIDESGSGFPYNEVDDRPLHGPPDPKCKCWPCTAKRLL